MFQFPKDDDFFKGDKSLKPLVKALESYIEIQFDMEGVVDAICALKNCSCRKERIGLRELSEKEKADLSEVLDSLQPLVDKYESNKNPVQIMKDYISKIQSELGTYGILMFINPRLPLSLEMLFSGAIIAYSKAFSSSERRNSLNCKSVFKGQDDLLNFHKKIVSIRNKHFAHSEYICNKHMLQYVVLEEQNEINLEASSHTYYEFWHKFDYILFYKVVTRVKEYLAGEINEKRNRIKETLSPSQLEELVKTERNLTSNYDAIEEKT